nr:P10-2 [Oat sterile dwarf virus]
MDERRQSKYFDSYTTYLPYHVDIDGKIRLQNQNALNEVTNDMVVFDEIVDTVETVVVDTPTSLFKNAYSKVVCILWFILVHLCFGIFRYVFKLCYYLLGLIICNRFSRLLISTIFSFCFFVLIFLLIIFYHDSIIHCVNYLLNSKQDIDAKINDFVAKVEQSTKIVDFNFIQSNDKGEIMQNVTHTRHVPFNNG